MKTPILALAFGIVLACPAAGHADESPNVIQDLFYGWDHSQRANHETVVAHSGDPFKPRTTDGLSSNVNACASYGCVGAGGGGD
jgi:hypothetical protein